MFWWTLSGILSYFSVPFLLPVFQNNRRENYLEEAVPTGLGTAFVLSGALLIIARSREERYAAPFAYLLLFFAILGLLDDFCGEETRKGFRGHLAGRGLSTGALKAWGGMAVSLAAAAALGSGWFQLVLNALIIALTANFLNLLDVRPGRAGKVFLILGFPLFLIRTDSLGPLLGMLWAVMGFLPWDLRRAVMMGDAGSNPLGAVLGLACVLALPLTARILLVLVLLALNILSERISFSKVIESNPVLSYLDKLGR
ncbi:MAG: hypothetical protein QM372_03465 [Bacillota bacterium]|nr:hypothetical protein [Bacillota bacterium]NLJ03051.1 hypothetical protein [Bacillota bacterium]